MLKLTDKASCCGCSACASVCPKGCITMQTDEEGFLYPTVDQTLCVGCGLCEKVCPVTRVPVLADIPAVYAAKHRSEQIKSKSSSGGMFSGLAQFVLERGGVVFGAGFDKDWNVCHQYAESMQDLDKLRRSKYVQSDIGDAFKRAKEFLDNGRQVFFTGTPCQIAGLKNYLAKEYDNLITADLICHGVPSAAIWQKFLAENFSNAPITAIDFRDKTFGWDASFLSVVAQGRKSPSLPACLRLFKILFYARRGKIFRVFFRLSFSISNLYERPSCHTCRFKGFNRAADFTMGDLWGVKYICPRFYDKKGVSVLLVNTPKGRAVFKKIQDSLVHEQVSFRQMVRYNPYYAASVPEHPKRAEFFSRYRKEPLNPLLLSLLNKKSFCARLLGKLIRKSS